ncbi:OLC1v1038412C1 [Oldenlandia corymbosa var. corymbosa]|uniref:OLC1v1038412C1 n=1 Tax=Oldenlandia corymbosa var. corymbosa TaxID=529605 RepID=A0AAV1D0U3_OLDCO|nr:OLC1v1038412C1 [Oldenlandia corymbosa var. corymbosa]
MAGRSAEWVRFIHFLRERWDLVPEAADGAGLGIRDERAEIRVGGTEPKRRRIQRHFLQRPQPERPAGFLAGRVRLEDQREGFPGAVVGPAGEDPGPRGYRRVPDPLRVELHPGERGGRGAADRVAAVRGAEDERRHADGGPQGGAPAQGE